MVFIGAAFMQILPSALRKCAYQVDDELIITQALNDLLTVHWADEQIHQTA